MAEPTGQFLDQRPGWAATALSLVTLAALAVNAPQFQATIAALAAIILAANFTNFRLPRSVILASILRVLLFAAIIVIHDRRRSLSAAWMLDPTYVYLFGVLCAAELAVQVWQRHKHGPPRGEIVLLTVLIMMPATARETHGIGYVPWSAPIYTLALVAALWSFRQRNKGGRPEARRRAWAWRSAATAVALAFGMGIALGTAMYGRGVTIYPFRGMFKWMDVDLDLRQGPPRLEATSGNRGSSARVLRVEGLHGEAHLRGLGFDRYDNGGWGPWLNERTMTLVDTSSLHADAPGPRIRVTRLLEDLGIIYAPLNAAGLAPMAGPLVQWDQEHDVLAPADEGVRYVYEVIAGPPQHQGPLCVQLAGEMRERYLAVPASLDPRVRELANQIAAGGDPLQRIAAIVRYLQKEHRYSLAAEPGPGDPVADFLLNKRSAHCQFFASSAVILMRYAGVPARYVTGYYAHESAGADDMVVRVRDAHAWAEAWVDGVGWVTVDATPGSGLPDQANDSVGMLQKSREWVSDRWDELKAWIARVGWTRLGIVVVALTATAMAIRAAWRRLLVMRRRKRAVVQSIYGQGNLAELARRFEALMRHRGAPCSAWLTWQEHVEALAGQRKKRLDVDRARAFVRAYEAERFGAASADGVRLADLLSSVEESSGRFRSGI